jgi:hypothetical protein
MATLFKIPEDFRAFMRQAASQLDWGEDTAAEIGPDAMTHECGRGGRIAGSHKFQFTYFTPDGHGRWGIVLTPQQIRAIAAGELSEVEADELEQHTRTSRGEPLLVWGDYDEDALRVRSPHELGIALDALRAYAANEPRLFRLWSSSDDQVVTVLNANDCALYVVQYIEGYGTSVGDPTRNDSFELTDHDAGTLVVPWSDCVPWRVARPALLKFADTGDLGLEVILDGRLPGQLLMLGDFDRASELATRRPPPADVALSSLPRKMPHGAWAHRLLKALLELGLIELDTAIFEAITARVSVLLVQLGEDAQESPEVAQQLAKDLAKSRGVTSLLATAGDLQLALRRTQEPPTMPVEMPFT